MRPFLSILISRQPLVEEIAGPGKEITANVAMESVCVISSNSHIQNYRATKGFILIRHRLRGTKFIVLKAGLFESRLTLTQD